MAIGNAKPRTGRKESLRLEEVVKIHEYEDGQISTLRFLGDQMLSVKRHWIKIYAGKEKKIIKIPRLCLRHNPLNEDEPLDVHCPYCDLSHGGSDTDATASYEFFYLINAINREAQADEPGRKKEPTKLEVKTGFKDINSKSWTPVEVARITSTMASRLQELKDLNKKKDKKTGKTKTYDVDDPKNGCDVMIRYKSKAAGSDKYSIDKGDRTPLTEEEKEYLTWNLSPELLNMIGLLSEKEAAEDFKRNEYVGGEEVDEDDEDDDYSLGKGKKGKKSKKKSRDDDDDEDDDRPAKKSKKKSRDDDDDDEDDEDDRPAKKSKKKSRDEDDDDDDDDEDDRPAKKSKKSDKSKSSDKKSKKGKKKGIPF